MTLLLVGLYCFNIFFFQADAGIRVRFLRLEFRRVLSRSTCKQIMRGFEGEQREGERGGGEREMTTIIMSLSFPAALARETHPRFPPPGRLCGCKHVSSHQRSSLSNCLPPNGPPLCPSLSRLQVVTSDAEISWCGGGVERPSHGFGALCVLPRRVAILSKRVKNPLTPSQRPCRCDVVMW